MFTEERKIEILKSLGYEIRPYDVKARLRESGFNAIVLKYIDYDVFKDNIYKGTIDSVFENELTTRIFR